MMMCQKRVNPLCDYHSGEETPLIRGAKIDWNKIEVIKWNWTNNQLENLSK